MGGRYDARMPVIANLPKSSPDSSLRERPDSFVRTWSARLLVIVSLGILTPFCFPDSARRLPQVVQWLLIAVLVFAASQCSSRFAIGISLLVMFAWSCVEAGFGNGTDWLALLVRFGVVMGLVAWVISLRQQLVASQRLARIDSLTGLPNRQALIEAIQAELSRARRFQRSFSLALLDCDGFKQINDSQGHLAGDEVLKQIGQSLRQHTRQYDCAGRWGGDEFLVLLCEVSRDDVLAVAERLRAAMRHNVERAYPSLSFSLGFVTIHEASSWEECIQAVDQAMYTAKRQGRNQTHFAEA